VPARVTEAESTGEERLRALLHDLPVDIREAGLMLVVKTLPGSAHAIAAALDRTRWPEVVGSIAGDDTVFVAFADRSDRCSAFGAEGSLALGWVASRSLR
jgi:arginine repressor